MPDGRRIAYFLLESFILFVFILGGVIYLVGYRNNIRYEKTLAEVKKCTAETTATVVHVNQFRDYNEESESYSYTYEGKFAYTVGGTEYSDYYKSSSEIKMGETWEIVYDPDDPSRCFRKDKAKSISSGNYVAPFFMKAGKVMAGFAVLLSVILIVVKIVYRIKAKQQRREADL